jgi:hypothetical protein
MNVSLLTRAALTTASSGEYGRAVRGVKVEDTKRGRKFQRTNVVAAQFKSDDWGNQGCRAILLHSKHDRRNF